jgi:protein SCO1/2
MRIAARSRRAFLAMAALAALADPAPAQAPSHGTGPAHRRPDPGSIGGPFRLVDHHGKEFTERNLHGRHALLVFGYTQCADLCPTALLKIAAVLEELGPLGARIVPVFVTVDPEHDTPERLATYVALFNPRLIGLTGARDEIAAMARAYGVYHAKVPQGGGYVVDHSTWEYFLGPDGKGLAVFGHEEEPAVVAGRIRAWIGR